jgi:pyruvate carboxylase subunit B
MEKKKFIDVMDTTFRDGFQSVVGGRVLMGDFLPALKTGVEIGIRHFEFGGGARFQAPLFYLNENPFEMMDRFRAEVGPDISTQTLSRGINTVALDSSPREVIELHAKMFKKHGTTVIRNFDALNDVNNLIYSGQMIHKHGLKHEVVVTMMDLPPGCKGAHDVAFYEKTLRGILDADIPYDSVCFKDASGTSSPQKVYDTIKMARKLLPEGTHIRLHTHETAGVSVACYIAALEAGADGIDLACAPMSGGTSQPDMIVMLHALKGKPYDLGLDIHKVREYEDVIKHCLRDYFIPPEATQVSPEIPFSPMPGGALTANTQMMRDFKVLDKFPEVIRAMEEVVVRGGFATSVTPVSQFYFQQAFNNVFDPSKPGQKAVPWERIADGYGRMVLGYFGKTPVPPDPELVKLISEKMNLPVTTENPIDIAERDPKKGLAYWKKILEENKIETSEENLFIAVSGQEKGVAFLQGKGKVMVRKISDAPKAEPAKPAEKKAESSVGGRPTSLSDIGTVNLAKPATYKITVDNQTYFAEVKQLD